MFNIRYAISDLFSSKSTQKRSDLAYYGKLVSGGNWNPEELVAQGNQFLENGKVAGCSKWGYSIKPLSQVLPALYSRRPANLLYIHESEAKVRDHGVPRQWGAGKTVREVNANVETVNWV